MASIPSYALRKFSFVIEAGAYISVPIHTQAWSPVALWIPPGIKVAAAPDSIGFLTFQQDIGHGFAPVFDDDGDECAVTLSPKLPANGGSIGLSTKRAGLEALRWNSNGVKIVIGNLDIQVLQDAKITLELLLKEFALT